MRRESDVTDDADVTSHRDGKEKLIAQLSVEGGDFTEEATRRGGRSRDGGVCADESRSRRALRSSRIFLADPRTPDCAPRESRTTQRLQDKRVAIDDVTDADEPRRKTSTTGEAKTHPSSARRPADAKVNQLR